MVKRVFLIQWMMFALVSISLAQDGPLADRYGPPPSSDGPEVADVVPDPRPPLPPAGPIDRGAPSYDRGEAPLAAPLAAPLDTVPLRTGPFGSEPEAASELPDTAPPRNEFNDTRPPAEKAVSPPDAAFRGRSSSTDARNARLQNGQQVLTVQQWIAELLAEPDEGALVGKPLTLQEALRGIRGETRQREIIDAYWRLSRSVANYHVTVQVLDAALGGLMGPGSARRRPTDRIEGRLQLDVARGKLAAVEAQADLAALIEWSHESFPLPTSLPHVGTYRTRYDEIFAERPNGSALRLHFLLPAQADVLRAHSQMLNVLAAGSDGEAADSFREQCREFLDAVYQYNRNIATYVLLATNDGEGADLVPMLIKVERAEGDLSDIASNVVPASTTPTSDAPGVERSVLVQPVEETNLVPLREDSTGVPAEGGLPDRQPRGDRRLRSGEWKRR